MIGHYLLTLSEEQEDRVLTGRLKPGWMVHRDGSRCLLGATLNLKDTCIRSAEQAEMIRRTEWPGRAVAIQYDGACRRFGAPRINAVIRNRILSNRARRTLHNRPLQMEPVAS